MEITKKELELFMQFKKFMEIDDSSNDNTKTKSRREKGTGSIVKLSGKRKRMYMSCVTLGYDEFDGKQIQKPLAYFKTKEDANKALDLYILEKEGKCSSGTLIEYIASVDGSLPKDNALDVNLDKHSFKNKTFASSCPTVEEIWCRLLTGDLSHLSERAIVNYKVSYNHIEHLHKRRIDTIKLNDLQPIFDDMMKKGTSQSKMNNIKIVLNYIFKYGMKYDYIEKNYVSFVKYRETLEDKKSKVPFDKNMIKRLFAHDDDEIVQSILIMIYTGMRPSELLQLKKENVHIDERYMIGGIKTKSGIDRIIPIHESIVKYVENFMNSNLHNMQYATYLIQFNKVKEKFKFKCTPHSGRHTFASLANENELNEYLIKKIMGHSANDLTKDVYTHVDTQRLIDEANKIPAYK